MPVGDAEVVVTAISLAPEVTVVVANERAPVASGIIEVVIGSPIAAVDRPVIIVIIAVVVRIAGTAACVITFVGASGEQRQGRRRGQDEQELVHWNASRGIPPRTP